MMEGLLQQKSKFINVTNHPSDKWCVRQKEDAERYGDIVDMLFPCIDPKANDADIDALVEAYRDEILKYDNPVVMVQGECVFTYRLVKRLKEDGLKVIASMSERKTIEHVNENGETLRQSVFDFVRFQEY